ncbi:hypothetical protein [Kitasatospora sp. HPMI-4]|uniref:hypothetical protein n=1 Tax=Kitasatospora sp. HPMI-4 TaxID=3448443 RepID=UPI003F1E4098
MESDNSPHRDRAAQDALAALDSVSAARGRVADLARSPWWYHAGLGLSFVFAFSTVSIGRSLIPYGVLLGLFLVPLVLSTVVNRSTGVAVDRYLATPGARRLSTAYSAAFAALIALGLVVELAVGLRGSMAGCGVLAFVLTVAMGRRIEDALLRDLRDGA